MRALLSFLLASGVVSTLHAAQNPKVGPGTFFVATNGNDGWSGGLPAPNQDRADGPFASVAKALEAARASKTEGAGKSIFIRGGLYFLNEPVVLEPRDSGLLLAAYGNEKPTLSGGLLIKGWSEVQVGDKTVLVADLPEATSAGWMFRELWVNGTRATRARHPNTGYLPVAELLDKAASWTQGHSRFRYREGDFQAWDGITNAEVLVMTRWVESRLPIKHVDPQERVITFGKRSVFELSSGDLYYAEGALEFLDSVGEWCLDAAAGKIYYMPRRTERAAELQAIAPVLMQVLRLEGEPESGQFIEGVTFRGIAFSHTEWCFPEGFQSGKHKPTIWPEPKPEIGGFAQAAIGVPGAVWGEGVQRSVFENCRFANVGNYGLELTRGCVGNRIQHCEFSNLGGGGIKLGTTAIPASEQLLTRDNEVSDCHIFDGGRMFHSAIGIWIGQSPGNRLFHNHIHDFYYTGISIGWTWGYSAAFATNNIVAFNDVHHIGVQSDGDGPILSDMAGIYTLGKQHGSVIHNNLWHDMAGIRYGGWGIYFDEGTSGILATSNIVYRTTHGGFHQHYGATNTVQNNIFAFARDFQVQRTRSEPHISFSFRTNVVYFDQGTLLGSNWKDDKYVINFNVYFDKRSAGEPSIKNLGAGTWDKWLERGNDTQSIVADPQFYAVEKDDFRLRESSPAFKLGFQPIDLRRVGPRK